jgi:hypothetical protein
MSKYDQISSPTFSAEPLGPMGTRDDVLRELLPYDYDYALDSGLVDMFAYNPRTAEDGLLHVLTGESRATKGGVVVVGFHHEPSAPAVWPMVKVKGKIRSTTRVDRGRVQRLPSKERHEYREFPFEPYAAYVVIDGLRKKRLAKNENGNQQVVDVRSSMFPKEYDALAVMQAIRIARDSRKVSQDCNVANSDGRNVINAVGAAPLIDGVSPMKIRMILDAKDKRVITAFPLLPEQPGIMRLTPQSADYHLFGVQ